MICTGTVGDLLWNDPLIRHHASVDGLQFAPRSEGCPAPVILVNSHDSRVQHEIAFEYPRHKWYSHSFVVVTPSNMAMWHVLFLMARACEIN